ncbi:tetratricopeptide repeat protein [Rhodoferax sediminis]|jgi:Flp pilus assembly protein TadD|uniref:Tetratricopeptide repeat protein n=1 Tax=Rhodoferax sediminis TaxID=2509614 RepID=A0A515D9W3_9BURK|nr:tetratricopeptide repeat protein [Rhodoferax sediminis]QDL37198.1 tetratricopeptide repeat protein [Rhodoferax sediminis]
MKHIPRALSQVLRLVVLATILGAPSAHADDYADVNQLARSGKQTEALAKADAYLATNPRDPQMRFIKGVILTDAGKTDDAVATFTKLTQDYPELPEPYNNLAVLYAAQSQFDKARAALEMAVRTNPSYAVAYENLGDVYARLAAQSYAKAVQLDASTSASVTPKLTLIRSMFSSAAKGQKSAAATPAAAASAPVAAASAPAAAKTSPSKKP